MRGWRTFTGQGSRRGINPDHATKLVRQLTALDVAKQPKDMSAPGWRLHELKGGLAGCWSITVSGTGGSRFRFEGTDVILVDYLDYH